MKTYLPAFLRPEHYPKLLKEGESVPTVAGATLLATYNFAPGTERYQTVEKFIHKLFDSIDKFRNGPRHPKWKEVNLAAEVPGWKRFKPAQDWINSTSRAAIDPAEGLQAAFDRFLQQRLKPGGKPLTNGQKQALLEEFMKWWKVQNARGPQ